MWTCYGWVQKVSLSLSLFLPSLSLLLLLRVFIWITMYICHCKIATITIMQPNIESWDRYHAIKDGNGQTIQALCVRLLARRFPVRFLCHWNLFGKSFNTENSIFFQTFLLLYLRDIKKLTRNILKLFWKKAQTFLKNQLLT